MRRIDWYLVTAWVLVLGSLAFIYRDWLFSLKTVAWSDLNYLSPQTMADFWPPREGWRAANGIGSSSASGLPVFFVELSQSFAALVHIPFELWERLVFFIPALVLMVVCPYLLTMELAKSRTAAIVAAAAFAFSGYEMDRAFIGHLPIVIADALVPLFVLAFLKLAQGVTLPRCAAMTAVFTAVLTFDLRVAYIAALVGLFMGVGSLIYRRNLAMLGRLAAVAGSCTASIVLIASWVLPALWYHRIAPALPIGFDSDQWLLTLSVVSLPEALGQWHAWPLPTYGTIEPFIPLYVLLLVLTLLPIAVRWRQPWVVGFTSLMLVFAFLMKGAHPPLTGMSVWLFHHVPGMYGFRDPTKFGTVVTTTASALMGYSTSLVAGWLCATTGRSWIGRAAPVAIISLILAAHAYAFSPMVGGALRAHDVPTEYDALLRFLAADSTFSRVLWLPTRTTFHLRTRVHPITSGIADLSGYQYEFTDGNEDNAEWFLAWIERPYAGWFMRDIGVRWIVVPDEHVLDDASYFSWMPRARIIAMLNRVAWAKFYRRFGGIDVYKMTPSALITASNAVIVLRGGPADLRHFESTPLPNGVHAAPVMQLPQPHDPLPPSSVEVRSGEDASQALPFGVSRLFFGGELTAGPTANKPGFVTEARGFALTAAVFEQPRASSASRFEAAVRMRVREPDNALGVEIFCDADLPKNDCASGYAVEWIGGVLRLVRHNQGVTALLALRPWRFSPGVHDLALVVRHPDFGTQQISVAVDGTNALFADDRGERIAYRGRIAVFGAGAKAIALRVSTAGDAMPISYEKLALPRLVKKSFVESGPHQYTVYPIDDTGAGGRTQSYRATDMSPDDCGRNREDDRAQGSTLVLRGPLASAMKTKNETRPFQLVLRDGEGQTICVPVPAQTPPTLVDVRAFLAEATAQRFARDAADHRGDYQWNLEHPVAPPVDDFVLAGISSDSGVPSSIAVDARVNPESKQSEVLVDGRAARDIVRLGPGRHAVENASTLDATQARGALLAAPELLGIRPVSAEVSQIDDLHYRVKVAAAPSWVVLHVAYDTGWTATMDGDALPHSEADGMFNAYYVVRAGVLDIEYAPRRLVQAGNAISIASAALLALYLGLCLLRGRFAGISTPET